MANKYETYSYTMSYDGKNKKEKELSIVTKNKDEPKVRYVEKKNNKIIKIIKTLEGLKKTIMSKAVRNRISTFS